LTQITFNIIERIYMFRTYKAIIRLSLEHLKRYKNCESYKCDHVFARCVSNFPCSLQIIYNGIETDKENRKQYVSVVYGAARSLCCSAAFWRSYDMLSTRRDVHDSEFRPIQQSYFLNCSMSCTHKRFDSCGLDHFYVVFM